MTEVGLGELGGCGLCGCKFAEGDEELVVYFTPIIQEGTDDGLDSFETGVVKLGGGVRSVGELLFGALRNTPSRRGRRKGGCILGRILLGRRLTLFEHIMDGRGGFAGRS